MNAAASCDADRTCTFNVTVKHEDTGWAHYVDHWRVLTSEQGELGKRILLHPHVSEQPFTRSLSGISVPLDVKQVFIEVHDSVHGYGGKKWTVNLP